MAQWSAVFIAEASIPSSSKSIPKNLDNAGNSLVSLPSNDSLAKKSNAKRSEKSFMKKNMEALFISLISKIFDKILRNSECLYNKSTGEESTTIRYLKKNKIIKRKWVH